MLFCLIRLFKCFFKSGILPLTFCLAFVSFSSSASPCRGAVEESDSIPSVSVSSVVIDFAKEVLGGKYSVDLGEKWEKEAQTHFKGWDVRSAEDFLFDLSSRIGRKDTVERLKSLSYFSLSDYEKFKKTVLLFESYIGEEEVAEKLRHSLSGFFYGGSFKTVRENVEYVESWIGREAVSSVMVKSLRGFSA